MMMMIMMIVSGWSESTCAFLPCRGQSSPISILLTIWDWQSLGSKICSHS